MPEGREGWIVERRDEPMPESGMLSRVFYAHGQFCASHPWEVIVGTLTAVICILSVGGTLSSSRLCTVASCAGSEEHRGVYVVVMTIMRCMALLYTYHKFRKLWKLGSKYILGIAVLFTIFSSFVFSSSVINFLQSDLSELNEALPFFLLLIDLSKASLLAQYALSSSCQKEVRENIARGMGVLGPTITLDTLVETLAIGVGTLSGVSRLEVMCCFACMSVVVNYIVFMSFFPACLSLALELSRDDQDGRPVWQLTTLARAIQGEDQKPNPVLQRVKVIMSAGLVLVHVHSRWPMLIEPSSNTQQLGNDTPGSQFTSSYWLLERWIPSSADQLAVLVPFLVLVTMYIFETRDALSDPPARQQANSQQSSNNANGEGRLLSMAPDLYQSCQLPDRSMSSLVLDHDTIYESKSVQTDPPSPRPSTPPIVGPAQPTRPPRPIDECIRLLNCENGAQQLTDDEVAILVQLKKIPAYQLEYKLGDLQRAVGIRRRIISLRLANPQSLDSVPFINYDYSPVMGACCENVIGYVPIPLGVAGPLLLDDRQFMIPMATTEGCLVASTNRGCRAIYESGGASSVVVYDGMTRGPVVRFPTATKAGHVKRWLDNEDNYLQVKTHFDSTSRFARLQRVQSQVAGLNLYMRFVARTGDAMGMNMVSKGAQAALKYIQEEFPDMETVSLSGNYCTDKKPAAINWIEGRGKSVICEAVIPSKVVREVLKTDSKSLIALNTSKNLVGSAVAGSIGGFNAQAANIVTAMFIATGQDPAQNVSSSNCITLIESAGPSGLDLHISCTMPSLEVGTVGGGTVLPAQTGLLHMLGVQGGCEEEPGRNAQTLARIVCATVLAGELSLLASLAKGDLVDSHMRHNRSQTGTPKMSFVGSTSRT